MEPGTSPPVGTPRDEVVARLAEAFRRSGVSALLLRAPGVAAAAAANVSDGAWRHDIDVLVPRSDRAGADAALGTLDWRLALGGLGAWRRIPTVSYHWDLSPTMDVHRGLPAGPLPPGSLRSVERMLISRGRQTPSGIPAPDAAALAVFAALQAARPGSFRPMWLSDLGRHVDAAGLDPVMSLASSVGVGGAVRWAVGAQALEASPRAGGTITDDRVRRAMWKGALWIRSRVRPRRLAGLIGGVPGPGMVVARVRFCDIELHAGPGAFIPQPVSEPMVARALAALPAGGSGLVVDVGTGVGAVALAIGRARPDVEVHGCDLSRAALRWAQRNARRLGISNVRFHRGSLLDPLDERNADRIEVITGNVPYVPPHVFEGRHDRDGAVVGRGVDGLGLQRELLDTSMGFLAPEGRLVIQMTADQWEFFTPSMISWGMLPLGATASGPQDVVGEGIADTVKPVGQKS